MLILNKREPDIPLTGLTEAVKACTPLVLLAGDTPTGAAKHNLDLVSNVFRNGGVSFKALQQLEHVGRGRDKTRVRIGFWF